MRCENHHHGEGGDRSVVVSLHFDKKGLTTTKTPFGVVVKLADLKTSGEPGEPALPRIRLNVAVPEPLWPEKLKIINEKWERVSDPATLVAPAQHPRAGDPSADDKDAKHHCAADCSCRSAQRPDRTPVAKGLPAPRFAPPNPRAYDAFAKNPPPVVRAVRIETIGTTCIAVIEAAPVRIGQKGELELCTSVKLAIETAREPVMTHRDRDEAIAEFKKLYAKDFDQSRVISHPERFISSVAEEGRLRDMAISHVINPEVVGPLKSVWPTIRGRTEYLIITDDVTWDPVKIAPRVARPGMIAAFEHLAQAKRARGISARVVSITDIVAGHWGDVRSGSRDLQEVIRRFLKIARISWGVSWLLLGGDTSIVPVRRVAGSLEGGVGAPGNVNPPAENTSYWTGSHLNIYTVKLGDWWSPSKANQLVRPDTGEFIHYDSAGTSSGTAPGWYFTTANDYKTRSAHATNFVRVEGPASLINAPLQFLYTWNTLPTDFYYASLNSFVIGSRPVDLGFFKFSLPYVYVPQHDWDAVGNGIYGQSRSDGSDIDGVVQQTDLSVGRAPVETAAEAITFVDKTLAYERLGRRAWRPANRNWPRKMLLASSDWGGRSFFFPTSNAIPASSQYHHDTAQMRSLLKSDTVLDPYAYEVIARITDDNRRLLPFKVDPNPAVRGWYFAISATNTAPSQQTINLFIYGSIRVPIPTHWIVVHGSIEERTPKLYEIDPSAAEGSMADQETLRRQVRTELPGIDRYDRYYEDEFDLSTSDRLAAPVDFLTESKLSSGLNAAPHFVSLSGHGSSDGCCNLSVAVAAGLTNGPLGFIAYADSCLTNQFDANDAMSETLIKNPNGGAVAYVGNTRFSWIGVGDDFQRAFFHRLTTTRHLGLLNDSRLSVSGTSGGPACERWARFTLNLLGDPELRVYRSALPPLILRPGIVQLRNPLIRIVAERPVPAGPPTSGEPSPVKGALVHVRQGKREFCGHTDDDGHVHLPEHMFDKGELEVTASHNDYAVATDLFALEA